MGMMYLIQYDIESKKSQKVTNYQGYEGLVSRFPNSNDILISRKKDRKTIANLYRLNTQTQSVTPFIKLKDSVVHQIFWAESLMLAIYKDDVVLIDFDGQVVEYLVKSEHNESYPAMTKDMNKLVYVSDELSKSDLYLKDIASGKVVRLTEDDYPEFAPVITHYNHVIYSGVETNTLDILERDFSGKLIKNYTTK